MSNFNVDYLFKIIPTIFKGVGTTLYLTLISFIGGLLIGFIIALIYHYRPAFFYQVAQVYVSFFRGSPIIAQMFFIYFGLPHFITPLKSMTAFTAAALTIALNMSAYMSENIRSAISSVEKGQVEAGLSVGMTNSQVMLRIVLPQAFRIALPSLSNNFIMTLKGTAVAFTIGVTEIMGKAKMEASDTYRYFECYAAVIIIYWALTVILTFFQKKFEKNLNQAYK